MKFKLGERGFVLAEFAIALPLLILLLCALGTVTLTGLKIAREQVADYTLETEAQYVIDRITADARAAHSVEISFSDSIREKIGFMYNTLSTKRIGVDMFDGETVLYSVKNYVNVRDRRYYIVDSNYAMNVKRRDDNFTSNPITGGNFYGKTHVTQFSIDREKLFDKILHVTLELQNHVTFHKVKFSTSVYMPACKKITYHEETILDEQ